MTDLAIKVENLSKRYRIGLQDARQETLVGTAAAWLKSPLNNFRRLRRLNAFADEEAEDIIWALRDVSFAVKHGEVVGIIGRNGAGKSTLLKILSRITPPTRGRVVLNGRVASLLEVGTGFHPELTGRENIYLNGAILGMRKAEIDRKFDEIVGFAEVSKFIDTPVKRYSSGMRVRLAFAVAAHLEPEILLVDEVLAVGDVEFQKKSLGKMETIAKTGRTVLFVSHNMGSIRSLCKHGILLQQGQLTLYDHIDKVVSQYLQSTVNKAPRQILYRPRHKECTFRVMIKNVDVTIPEKFSNPLKIKICYESQKPVDRFAVEWFIRDIYGQRIMSGLSAQSEGLWFIPPEVGQIGEIICQINHWRLPGGLYTLSLMLDIPYFEYMDFVEDAIEFFIPEMMPGTPGFIFSQDYGWLLPEVEWQSQKNTTVVEIK
jgi:lipopolysaccharide transport system ATP-binding protein